MPAPTAEPVGPVLVQREMESRGVSIARVPPRGNLSKPTQEGRTAVEDRPPLIVSDEFPPGYPSARHQHWHVDILLPQSGRHVLLSVQSVGRLQSLLGALGDSRLDDRSRGRDHLAAGAGAVPRDGNQRPGRLIFS